MHAQIQIVVTTMEANSRELCQSWFHAISQPDIFFYIHGESMWHVSALSTCIFCGFFPYN
jgi:hypothetical protein